MNKKETIINDSLKILHKQLLKRSKQQCETEEAVRKTALKDQFKNKSLINEVVNANASTFTTLTIAFSLIMLYIQFFMIHDTQYNFYRSLSTYNYLLSA